jgi:hypothetical protein
MRYQRFKVSLFIILHRIKRKKGYPGGTQRGTPGGARTGTLLHTIMVTAPPRVPPRVPPAGPTCPSCPLPARPCPPLPLPARLIKKKKRKEKILKIAPSRGAAQTSSNDHSFSRAALYDCTHTLTIVSSVSLAFESKISPKSQIFSPPESLDRFPSYSSI